jgi:hypothetical protein
MGSNNAERARAIAVAHNPTNHRSESKQYSVQLTLDTGRPCRYLEAILRLVIIVR